MKTIGYAARSTTTPLAPWTFERREAVSRAHPSAASAKPGMLDFRGEKGIHPDVEMIRMDEINHAFGRMKASDMRYRFVIDMASLDASAA